MMQKTKREASDDTSFLKNKKMRLSKTVGNPMKNSEIKNKSKKVGYHNSTNNNKKALDKKIIKDKTQTSKETKGAIFREAKNKKISNNQEAEKPRWSEMKKQKKELRLVRRKAKATVPVFEMSHKARLLAAQIQRKVVKPDFREKACKELHGLLKGQYKHIALTHDLSRVIQVLLKHSALDIRNEITHELLDIMVQMVRSKYAHHSVKRILKYGTEFIRHEVIKKFFGNIVTLASHTISAPVVDYAYTEFATQKEKNFMQQEFYGDIYKNSKDDNVKTLSDAYRGSPEMKGAILSSCKANIQRILDKNLHDSELLHSVLYDFICECGPEDRAELITTLSPLIVPLSNSLPGVNAGSMCVWQGTNKDKKTILKVVKEHVVPLSIHKTGYRLLLAIFDSVDDTVLVKKAIVSVLANNLKDVAKDHWGKMTLHWLVKPNDTAAFHPNFIKFLKEGSKSGTSKKDSDIRVSELREGILPSILKDIEANAEFWLKDPTIGLLTAAVLSIHSTKEVLDSISRVICRPDWQLENNESILAVEDPGMHMCLKKMALLDRGQLGDTLGKAIVGHLSDETLQEWLTKNRGCFFLLKLLETNSPEVVKEIRNKIVPHEPLLQEQNTQGAKLLLRNINEC